MPRFIDRGNLEKLSSKLSLLKTELEAVDHEEKLEQAIRENIGHILEKLVISDIAEKKVLKVNVSLKDPGFIFQSEMAPGGDGSSGTGEEGEENDAEAQKRKGGDKSPPFSYEKEVDLEKIISRLFDLVKLPSGLMKRIKRKEPKLRQRGIKRKGPPPRLNRRATFLEKRKREIRAGRKLSYLLSDRRYHALKPRTERGIKGVVFLIRDKSDSMDKEKVTLMKSLLFLVYWFLLYKYKELALVYILHDSEAEEVTEDKFWRASSRGGTYLSSGIRLTNELIDEKFSPHNWNIYVFQFSDGENSSGDSKKYMTAIQKVLRRVTFFGYTEVQPEAVLVGGDQGELFADANTVFSELKGLTSQHDNFHLLMISSFTDVGKAFLRLFNTRKEDRK